MIAVQPIEAKELGNINLKDTVRIANAFAAFGFAVSPMEAATLWIHRSRAWNDSWCFMENFTDAEILDQIGRLTKKDAAVIVIASDEDGAETKFLSLDALSDIVAARESKD